MDAYAKSQTPTEERDRRGTPVEVFDAIADQLSLEFTLDVCADEGNYKVSHYLDKQIDALAAVWQGVCWMNPPYSDPYPWCKKAANEVQELATVVVGLLPDDRSTKWYKEQVYPKASAIYTTDRRVPFLDMYGVPQNGNPKGSVIVVWTPWMVDSPAQGYLRIPKYSPKTKTWTT